MAKYVFKDARVYVGGYDLSAQHNYITLELARAVLEATDFTSDTQIAKLGLRSVRCSGRGFFEAGAAAGTTPKKIDNALFDNLSLADVPVTIVPTIGAGVGGPAYSIQAATARIRPFLGQHGQLMGYEYDLVATAARVVRGRILHTGTIDADGDGTAVELGAVTAAQKIYGVMHAYGLGDAADTLDLKIQSDDAEAFLDPTDRIVFGQAAGFDAEWAELAGAITDTWWRVAKDISVGGDYSAIVLAGIQV